MRYGGRKFSQVSGDHIWAGCGRVSRQSPGLKEKKEEGLAEARGKRGKEERWLKVVYQMGSTRKPKVHSSRVIRGCLQRYKQGVGKSAGHSASHWESQRKL